MTFNLLLKLSIVLQKFYQSSLNAKISYSLYKLLKKIQEELDFYSKEEEKLIETYADWLMRLRMRSAITRRRLQKKLAVM